MTAPDPNIPHVEKFLSCVARRTALPIAWSRYSPEYGAVVFGLAAGVAAALFLGRAIRGLLFEIQPTDPLTIAGVAAVLVVVSTLARFIPARRAAGTDAVAALQFE